MRDQLGLTVVEIKPVGLESSAGSTPLRLRVEGDPDQFLFAKLYTKGHVRADRWYKLWRTVLYGSLEDESPFKTVRRLVTYEDYALRLLQDIGVRTARPYGIVEITPEREYMLVTEFFDGAVEIGEAEVDDAVIDQGLTLIRKMWDAGIAHRDIKPGNLMVRSGELLLIDVAFVQVRPSPWRQAVDLGNMMLVLAVRTDPQRVYQRALRHFTEAELAEAFAATRGVASPTQLRAFMKRDPRDLLGEFRALAPERPPIVLQRWSVRRVALAAAMLVVTVVAVGVRGNAFFPAAREHRRPCPRLRHRPLDDPSAQAVPSAALLPCIAALPSGWSIDGVDIASGKASFWLDSDRAGERAATITLAAACDTDGRPPDPLRPARNAAVRAAAEPGTAVFGPALLHLPRRLRQLRVPVRTGRLPRPGRNGQQRGRLRAAVEAGRLCPADRGPGPVRARRRVSRMSWRAVPGPEGPALLAARGRDAALGTVVVVLTVGVFAAVGDHGTLASIQRLDDAWLRLMISGQAPPLTAIAKVFNILGLVYVTLPVRMAVAGFLALRRRWWNLAAFTAAVVLSEVLIGVLKGVYERAEAA